MLLLDSFDVSLTDLRKYGQSLLYIFLVVTNLYLAALSQRPNLQIIPQHVAAILSKLGTVLAIMLENRGHLDALRILGKRLLWAGIIKLIPLASGFLTIFHLDG